MFARVGGELVQDQRQMHRRLRIEHEQRPRVRDPVVVGGANQDLFAHELHHVRTLHTGPGDERVSLCQRLNTAGEARDKSGGLLARTSDWVAIACTVASVFLTRCASSSVRTRCNFSARLGSVMSRPTFDAPTTFPDRSRRGDTVSDTSTPRPSLATPTVS